MRERGSNVKYVLINDVHLSDRAPASCTDTYLDDLFDLLGQAASIAEHRGAAIVLAGDVFHHKTPSRTTHATVMRLIQWAQQTDAPVYAVAGNHDLSHDRVSSLGETQPLGVVFASGAITELDGWMPGGQPVYGVPWQMNYNEINVTEALADYRDDFDERQHRLVVTHAPLYPPGKELKYEYYPAAAWAEAMGNRGTVHYGHVHEPHGVYLVDGVRFSNCGALSRGSLHEHNLTRTPRVAVWDSTTGFIEHLPLNAKPAEEVFRLAAAEEKKAKALDLRNFLSNVEATRLDITSSASVIAHLRETSQDEGLIALVERLLEDAEK